MAASAVAVVAAGCHKNTPQTPKSRQRRTLHSSHGHLTANLTKISIAPAHQAIVRMINGIVARNIWHFTAGIVCWPPSQESSSSITTPGGDGGASVAVLLSIGRFAAH
ncbi:unnamed protein product [Ceratitis capitata]|uniref:(Mediterranean fruit fly) hypothetical protein n=1 Tax=Ceratitis capitata TaxID=7213 RepID=A0A811VGU3_CERCA|nr:unnamed protein product [Ceratitis capitata]